ncbi:Mur ligase family protein [Lactovum miscens]|uniref:Lipid II isoglutaminyl synthase (glutamine-hydrolyzing) subunit MurT n=1 Tax=Lactovum miscens TaxID=190387 RepID=A0A841C1T7_9LACT|nr:Mur ligase family protein [Lactovum miscens]MBB5887876.1 UDP-N-acetylmuramoyl-L-alanyl-D-glutamate--2,6-diaminopimelate ligase [Lactovum miscens]
MTLRSQFAKTIGKTAGWGLRTFLHRGSTLPGVIALKLDPDILKNLTKDYEIIVITGTNGKTLTTALTVGIFENAFGSIVTNTSGANMVTGIVSTFLKAPRTRHRSKKFAILEIDEASLPKVTKYIKPNLFVFTNIFRDQMDRYGEIYTTYDFIVKGAANSPKGTVLLNADSPIFNSRQLVNPVKYYGFDHESNTPHRAHYNTAGVLCPNCHHILDFKMNTYANLGNYICLNCGFHRPKLDYRLSELVDISSSSSQFVIDENSYKINVGGLYNIYNALAAVAVAEHFDISPDLIKSGFEKSRAVFGRQETFKVGNKQVTIILIKNPVGTNQAIELLKLVKGDLSLIALLNANYADGIDTSWIWDANFEILTSLAINEVTTGGIRSSEMARRLRVAGLDPQEKKSHEEILESIKNSKSDQVYVLATYTAMLEIREVLAKAGYITGELK